MVEPQLCHQYLAAISANIGGLSMGAVIGYSSPVGPLFLNGTGNNLLLNETQVSWFSSSMNIGALLGGLTGGFFINLLGRRGALLASLIPFLFGWGLLAGAQNFTMVLIGRIITGYFAGLMTLVCPTYIGEFSSKNIRGTLVTMFQLMFVVGVLYVYAFGSMFNSFRYIACACAVPPIICSLAMFFQFESPNYLLSKGKDEECKKALVYFRGPDYDIMPEYEILKKALDEDSKKKVSFKDLTTPHVLKPLIICLLIMVFLQLSGINAVLFNLNSIFLSSGSSMSESLSSIIIAVIMFIATFAAATVIDKLGRKLLLIVSATFMMISLVALGIFFYMLGNAETDQETQDVIDSLGWLPLTSLSVFIVAFSIGYGPVAWVIMSELFSSDVREMASSLVIATTWAMAFIVTLTFVPLQNAIHDYGVYWFFSACCLLSLIFCFLVVPETKGKTIDEITKMFGRYKLVNH